jgi:AcrR family transcriptional regulator
VRSRPVKSRPKRRPRDRDATEAAILAAVAQVLSTAGFGKLGVNAIAGAAGVDKVLIYRYFGGLPQLLRAFGERGEFWPTAEELIGSGDDALTSLAPAERFSGFIDRFIDQLRARPLTIEILALETVERNELTAVLEDVREQWGRRLAAALIGPDIASDIDVTAIMVMLIAGIQYLLVRSRKIRIFGTIDLRSDKGWRRLKASSRQMAAAMFEVGVESAGVEARPRT